MTNKTTSINNQNYVGKEAVYIDEKEVSRITGRALSTLRNDRFMKKGIPYIKCYRSVMYLFTDVIDFMEARKINTEMF